MLIDGINVLKKPFVDVFVEEMKKIEEVKGLILFGSAITERCREDSDVDILLIISHQDFWAKAHDIGLVYRKAMNVQDTDFDVLPVDSMEKFMTGESMLYMHLRDSGEYKILFERD